MKSALALLLLASFATATGCTSHTALSTEERVRLERELASSGRARYLRLSFYVTPFFRDASKKLLTAVPPEEVRLLEDTGGEPVSPGPVERILPAGTRVHVLKTELPTAFVVAERILFTPRTQPWVYLKVDGEPEGPPLILVLRPQIKSAQEFLAEMERSLAEQDPSRTMEAWPEAVRAAVRNKTAVTDMPAEALEMAWGPPELKRISFEGSVRREDWVYPGGKRRAQLSDGRVTQFDAPKAQPPK